MAARLRQQRPVPSLAREPGSSLPVAPWRSSTGAEEIHAAGGAAETAYVDALEEHQVNQYVEAVVAVLDHPSGCPVGVVRGVGPYHAPIAARRPLPYPPGSHNPRGAVTPQGLVPAFLCMFHPESSSSAWIVVSQIASFAGRPEGQSRDSSGAAAWSGSRHEGASVGRTLAPPLRAAIAK
jgi:hypothetical protein